jgi:hypothetical protein
VRREMERRERDGKEDTQAEEERAVNQSKKMNVPGSGFPRPKSHKSKVEKRDLKVRASLLPKTH